MRTSIQRFHPRAQANTWEELYYVKTDECGRIKTKECQRTGCPTCRVKVQRFKHSTKGGFGDLQKF